MLCLVFFCQIFVGTLVWQLEPPQNPIVQKIVVSRDVNFKEILNNGYSSLKIDEDVPFSVHRKKIPVNKQTTEPEVPLDDSRGDEQPARSVVKDPVCTRSLRDRTSIQRPARYEVNLVEFHEPKTYEEAISCANAEEWKNSIKEKLKAHKTNGTWSLTVLSQKKKTISSTWIFKVKHSPSEGSMRFKARLCAKDR
ncbi:pol polyprotein [Lasius niger]|uniref:Pol polyprotein n=1 Tax=Lasius niger TaxID=67767 RepID=A0A0J7K335_LASNI|nr:pol polyprotein [Lasius niger]